MITPQNIVLDSCVVIGMIEDPKLGLKLKQGLKGKSARIILCDVVISEINRVRGYAKDYIISKISKILGRQVQVFQTNPQEKEDAKKLSVNFLECHNGDNLILAFCKIRDYILVTFDRALLRTCNFVGVIAFSPLQAGGI
ncbi:MAG: PIN domain-containing protein [Thaumarchaeota archaeon]|nr:PIN domain-containing protein [Nitrososphaerota archaeon]